MTSIDPRLLDPTCDANDAENFNRLLSYIDKQFKVVTATELHDLFISRGWSEGGTLKITSGSTEYFVTKDSGFICPLCPNAFFENMSSTAETYIVMSDDAGLTFWANPQIKNGAATIKSACSIAKNAPGQIYLVKLQKLKVINVTLLAADQIRVWLFTTSTTHGALDLAESVNYGASGFSQTAGVNCTNQPTSQSISFDSVVLDKVKLTALLALLDNNADS